MLLWKAADNPEPSAADITKFAWERKSSCPSLDASPLLLPPCWSLSAVAAKLHYSHVQQQSAPAQQRAEPVPATASAKAMIVHDATCSHTQSKKSKMTRLCECGEEDEVRQANEDEVNDEDMEYNSAE